MSNLRIPEADLKEVAEKVRIDLLRTDPLSGLKVTQTSNYSLKISLKCYDEKIISHLFSSVESKTSRSSSQGSSTGRKSEDRLTEAEEADGEDADSQEDVSIFEDDFHQKVFAKSPISFKGRRSNSKLRISLKNTVDRPSSVDDPKNPRHHKSQPNPVCLNFLNLFHSSLVFGLIFS